MVDSYYFGPAPCPYPFLLHVGRPSQFYFGEITPSILSPCDSEQLTPSPGPGVGMGLGTWLVPVFQQPSV